MVYPVGAVERAMKVQESSHSRVACTRTPHGHNQAPRVRAVVQRRWRHPRRREDPRVSR